MAIVGHCRSHVVSCSAAAVAIVAVLRPRGLAIATLQSDGRISNRRSAIAERDVDEGVQLVEHNGLCRCRWRGGH